jgi:hypothetical protein
LTAELWHTINDISLRSRSLKTTLITKTARAIFRSRTGISTVIVANGRGHDPLKSNQAKDQLDDTPESSSKAKAPAKVKSPKSHAQPKLRASGKAKPKANDENDGAEGSEDSAKDEGDDVNDKKKKMKKDRGTKRKAGSDGRKNDSTRNKTRTRK